MSLIIGCSYDDFVIMTGDTKATLVRYKLNSDGSVGDEIGESSVDIKVEKARKISDYVLMGTVGSNAVSEAVEDAISLVVKQDDDLETCAQKLQEIISRFKEGAKEGAYGVENPIFAALDTEDQPYFRCYMTGFYECGETGTVYFTDGPGSHVKKLENYSEELPLPAFVRGVGDEIENPFNLRGREINFDNLLAQIRLVHTLISFANNDAVSDDCHIHVMRKSPDGGKPEFSKEVFNAGDSYALLNSMILANIGQVAE